MKHLKLLACLASLAWSFSAHAEPPSPAPSSAALPPAAPAHSRSLRTAGWITVGAGGALAASSAILYGVSFRENRSLKDARGNGSLREANDAFKLHLLEAKIFAVASVAALGTGITLILVSPKTHDVQVTASIGRLSLRGSF